MPLSRPITPPDPRPCRIVRSLRLAATCVLVGVMSACATPTVVAPDTSVPVSGTAVARPARPKTATAAAASTVERGTPTVPETIEPPEPTAVEGAQPAVPKPGVASPRTAPATAGGTAAPKVVEVPESPTPVAIDLTSEPDDLWARIRQGFAMPDLDDPLVEEHQRWYLARPQYLQRMLDRGRKYLYYIVEELEKRGMPTELALLPMVESAYNPTALSPAQASGLWQFVPSTGKLYGLEQDWWRDERRDVVASTQAALDYLQHIYEMHGDWQLALASYNWGENAVARAVAKNQAAGLPTDFESLSLPPETRHYVPKLQALKNIIAHPELFHIHLDPIPNAPYLATLARKKDIDVAVAARLAGMPVDEFRELNPQFKRPVIRGGQGTQLVLPADRVDTFRTRLEAHDEPLVSWRTYTLRRKERLDQVAARFGTTGLKLRQANGLDPRARINAGTTLLVPATEGADGAPEDPPHRGKGVAPHGSRHGKRHGKPQRLTHNRTTTGRKTGGRTSAKPARRPASNATLRR